MISFIRHRTVTFLACIIGLESLIVMTGWIFGLGWLTRIVPFGINMKFITAFLFFISALELYFISRAIQHEDERALVVLPGISLTAILVTVILLVSRLLGVSTGLENLFLRPLSISNPIGISSMEGWPAIPTLVSFLILGAVGILSLFRGLARERLLMGSGYCILIIGLLAIAGYALHQPALYYKLSISSVPMAPNTALSFVLLGFGLAHVRKPERRQ